MYRIFGADGQPYGPVTADRVREWIAAGRANAQSLTQLEGASDWKPLSAFPEFADALAAKAAPPPFDPPPVAGTVDAVSLADEILRRDYTLQISSCFSRAWELVKGDFWPIIGISALVLLLLSATHAVYVGIVVTGPLLGGLYWYYLKKVRGQRSELQDAFAGFSLAFLQLFLGGLVSTMLTIAGVALCVLPGIYLMVAWCLALPLIIDKRMQFWDAMELSRKVVTRHWWSFFGLILLSALLNLGGALLCCVGTFITTPVTMLAMAFAYEDIIGNHRPQTP